MDRSTRIGVRITLLWTIDDAYLLMTDAVFVEGVKLEVKHHKWLPQIRRNMMAGWGPRGIRTRFLLFYNVSLTIVLLLGVISLVTWAYNLAGPYRAVYVVIAALPLILGWNYLLYRSVWSGIMPRGLEPRS